MVQKDGKSLEKERELAKRLAYILICQFFFVLLQLQK